MFQSPPVLLAPFNPPLGPQPASYRVYCPEQVTLVLREKVFSFSGDDFLIQSTEGMSVCKCKGKAISLHAKKRFTDMQDNEIFTLSNKLMNVLMSFRGESPDGQADFEIRGHFQVIGSRSTVHFRNAADGQQIELEVKGNWIERKAQITLNGRPVAMIQRSFMNARQVFGNAQTVSCSLHPLMG